MLLAYLLFVVGLLWLMQILLQGRLQVTLPKLKWQPTNSFPSSHPAPVLSLPIEGEDTAILGPSKGLYSQSFLAESPLVSKRTDLPKVGVEQASLEASQSDISGSENQLTEFACFSREVGVSLEEQDSALSEEGDEAQLVIHTFSDQLSAYPMEESQTQPDHFEIPFSDLKEGVWDSEVVTVSLDELIREESDASDMPLDTYFARLQTVESILEDIGKSIRRKQTRQTVDQLCRQFTDVLGHYSMLNDKNVIARLDRVIKPQEAPDYAREFMRLQRESLGDEEFSSEEIVAEFA